MWAKCATPTMNIIGILSKGYHFSVGYLWSHWSLLGLAHRPGKLLLQGSSHLLFSVPVALFPRCLPDSPPHLCRSLSHFPFLTRPLLTSLVKLTTSHSLFFFHADVFSTALVIINCVVCDFSFICLFSVFLTGM